jgi:predicted ATP-grasp superfamily ATP-dependent carboligase
VQTNNATKRLENENGVSAQKKPVLILGVEPRITVPVARSLHRIGVPVAVASLSARDLTIRSRAIFTFLRLPNYEKSPSRFVAALSAFISEHGFDTLIPVTDGALSAVTQHYESLSALLRLACPPAQIIDRVLNKEATLAVAAQCGIRVPREYDVTELKNSGDISQLRLPLVAKPRQKSSAELFKVRYFHSHDELRKALENGMLDDAILQEYSPGQGVGVEVLYVKGTCIATFQHRRLKEVPHTGGAAAMAIAEPIDPDLKNMALKLLAGLGWEGVAMVEFRHDRASGDAALMEVNGRYWGTVALAILAGVDFPAYEWQFAHGINPAVPQAYDVGLRWRWSAGLLRRWHGIIKGSGKVVKAQNLSIDYNSPTDEPGVIRDSLWSVSDPLPAISEMFKLVRDLALTDARAVWKKLLP